MKFQILWAPLKLSINFDSFRMYRIDSVCPQICDLHKSSLVYRFPDSNDISDKQNYISIKTKTINERVSYACINPTLYNWIIFLFFVENLSFVHHEYYVINSYGRFVFVQNIEAKRILSNPHLFRKHLRFSVTRCKTMLWYRHMVFITFREKESFWMFLILNSMKNYQYTWSSRRKTRNLSAGR